MQGYLTVKQLSKQVGLTSAHIRRLLGEGRIDGFKVGRDWLISQDAADRWLAQRKKKK